MTLRAWQLTVRCAGCGKVQINRRAKVGGPKYAEPCSRAGCSSEFADYAHPPDRLPR